MPQTANETFQETSLQQNRRIILKFSEKSICFFGDLTPFVPLSIMARGFFRHVEAQPKHLFVILNECERSHRFFAYAQNDGKNTRNDRKMLIIIEIS